MQKTMNTLLSSISYQYSADGSVRQMHFVHFDGITVTENPIFVIISYPDYSFRIIEKETKELVYTHPPGIRVFNSQEIIDATEWEKYVKTEKYCRKMTAKLHTTIYCELMMRVCTPERLYQWNEGAAEQFPEEYLRKCAEYK
jgi:hypothetical protein